MRDYLIKKTHDVSCNKGILENLGAEYLLYSREYDLIDYLTCDIDLLGRRSKIFYDTENIPGLDALIEGTVSSISFITQMLKLQASVTDSERGLYSVKQLSLYFENIDRLYSFYEKAKEQFTSEDYTELFEQIALIYNSEEYKRLKKNTQSLLEQISHVKSISVAFNLDPSMSASDAGIISVNSEPVRSGGLIDRILGLDGKSVSGEMVSMAPLAKPSKVSNDSEFNALNYFFYSALNKIFKRCIKQWEPEINAYLDSRLGFFISMLPDLRFVCDVVSIQKKLRALKLQLSVPIYRDMEEKCFTAKNIYNPVLAINKAETNGSLVVENDFSFDENGRIYLLTGPNNGGKTAFMCAIGITQIMAQIGMAVPAERLEISPASGIFVELPKYQKTNDKGRLADECSKISEIFKKTDKFSFCLMDEAFSSTDHREAVELSIDVLRAMSHIGARGIYATHLHELTSYACEINEKAANGGSRLDFLVAGVAEGGEERTYKMIRRKPDGKSYAKTIAEQYGISFESLVGDNS